MHLIALIPMRKLCMTLFFLAEYKYSRKELNNTFTSNSDSRCDSPLCFHFVQFVHDPGYSYRSKRSQRSLSSFTLMN